MPASDTSTVADSCSIAGDPVTDMHFVLAGSINLVRPQRDGSILILQRAGPGSILAEASLYSGTYHCDAIAFGSADTRAYPKASLKKLLATSPEFSGVWTNYHAQELQRSRLRSEILSLKTVAERLDAWIAWNGDSVPRQGRMEACRQPDRRKSRGALPGDRQTPPSTRRNVRLALRRQSLHARASANSAFQVYLGCRASIGAIDRNRYSQPARKKLELGKIAVQAQPHHQPRTQSLPSAPVDCSARMPIRSVRADIMAKRINRCHRTAGAGSGDLLRRPAHRPRADPRAGPHRCRAPGPTTSMSAWSTAPST